jgi:DUF1009 family protein
MEKRISIKQLKQLLGLVDKHKLDLLELPGVKVTKSKHLLKEVSPTEAPNTYFEPTSVDEIDAEIKKALGVKS